MTNTWQLVGAPGADPAAQHVRGRGGEAVAHHRDPEAAQSEDQDDG